MGPVDLVVGAYAEAERMLLMINKNPGAYFFFYLTSMVERDKQFMQRVVSGTVDPTFIRDIKNCEWDKEKGC